MNSTASAAPSPDIRGKPSQPAARPFWCAELSIRGKEWAVPRVVSTEAPAGIHPEAAAVARRRGVSDLEKFFRPTLAAWMPDPNVLSNMEEAVGRVCDAID